MAKRHIRYRADAKGERSEAFRSGDRVVGYFRDSGGVNQDRSVDEQLAEWRKECAGRGLVAHRAFEDRARSGTKARGRRQFGEMIEYFASGQAAQEGVRGLLLWSFSRFAREQDDFQFYVSSIRRAGYVVQSLTDHIPEGDFGRFFEALVSWKDAQFSRDLRKHVERGQNMVLSNYREDGGLYHIAESGEEVQLTGGGFPPVGYERVPVVTGMNRRGTPRYNAYWRKTKDEDLAGRVRRAWEMMLEGASYPEIEAVCKLGKENNSYNDFFQTETYLGIYSYGDFRREGAFEAYVTREEYERVQKLWKSGRRGRGGALRCIVICFRGWCAAVNVEIMRMVPSRDARGATLFITMSVLPGLRCSLAGRRIRRLGLSCWKARFWKR